ncbi:MAG: hypothetical protein WC178_03535 [Candidatus Paceibacterota bacterium]|jgi:hypothetical protein
MFWLIKRAQVIEGYKYGYGEDVFNEAVELCRSSALSLEDCLEICKNRKYRELVLNF